MLEIRNEMIGLSPWKPFGPDNVLNVSLITIGLNLLEIECLRQRGGAGGGTTRFGQPNRSDHEHHDTSACPITRLAVVIAVVADR